MNEVKIAPELPLNTVAFALTLLCGPAESRISDLKGITAQLSEYSHDTIFKRAYEIARDNNRQLFGRDASYAEFLADFDGRDALFMSLSGDTPVIGVMCGGRLMAPHESVAPDNHPDQKLLILTAMGIARPEPEE